MANNDFMVGDRVRVYETCPYVGIVEKTGNDTPAFSGCILVRGIGNQFGWHHEKKCRRLKPKKRREFEINISHDGNVRGCVEVPALSHTTLGSFYSDNETIRVREVSHAQKAKESSDETA